MLKIRKAGHDRVREFGKPFREQIIAEDQRVREEIRALLTPEQARTFDGLPHFRINPEPGRPGAGRPPPAPTATHPTTRARPGKSRPNPGHASLPPNHRPIQAQSRA